MVRELIDDWWRFSLGNLATHVGPGGEVLRVDFADPSPEVRLSVVIDAPLGGAWNLGMSDTVDGHRIESAPQRILAFEQDRVIHISWPDWRGQAEVPDQEIGFRSTAEGEGTKVDFVHRGSLRAAGISDYPFGWGHFLGEIARAATAASPSVSR